MEQEKTNQSKSNDKKSDKTKKLPYKAKCSLLGKMANIVPCDDRLEIYTTSTALILLSLWLFAAAGFALTFLITKNYIIWLFSALLFGVAGYLLATKLYSGKLTKTFLYDEISCVIADVPELTIIHDDEKMYVLKILPKDQKDFEIALFLATKNSKYETTKKNNRYYVKLK
ncbi:MAG: hypothetical protein RSA99_00010 [Oscillospiraceae bacterium]